MVNEGWAGAAIPKIGDFDYLPSHSHDIAATTQNCSSAVPSWGKLMEKITESMLVEFSQENGLANMPENLRFEHFASYSTIQRLYGETFDTSDVVLGNDEPGIDGIAIIVNGNLIYDVDVFNEVAESATSLDVVFIFIQADRSRSFETGKMGNPNGQRCKRQFMPKAQNLR
jgi:hypothetical protein